eukprot:21121-Pelagococcus_subviridis.AAC.10
MPPTRARAVLERVSRAFVSFVVNQLAIASPLVPQHPPMIQYASASLTGRRAWIPRTRASPYAARTKIPSPRRTRSASPGRTRSTARIVSSPVSASRPRCASVPCSVSATPTSPRTPSAPPCTRARRPPRRRAARAAAPGASTTLLQVDRLHPGAHLEALRDAAGDDEHRASIVEQRFHRSPRYRVHAEPRPQVLQDGNHEDRPGRERPRVPHALGRALGEEEVVPERDDGQRQDAVRFQADHRGDALRRGVQVRALVLPLHREGEVPHRSLRDRARDREPPRRVRRGHRRQRCERDERDRARRHRMREEVTRDRDERDDGVDDAEPREHHEMVVQRPGPGRERGVARARGSGGHDDDAEARLGVVPTLGVRTSHD